MIQLIISPALAVAVAATSTINPANTSICLAPASTQLATGNNADAANAVRETFSSFLTGPTIGVKSLSSRLPSQAREEARQSGCRYVLFITVKLERKSSSGLLGKITSRAAQEGAYSLGIGASSTVGRVAASAVAGAAGAAAASMATSTKVRDELELKYQLEASNGQVLVKDSFSRKAKSDGEDLLTPLAEKASEQIASAAAK